MKNLLNGTLDSCPFKSYDHARLIVKDLQKSKSWYQMILGVNPHIDIDKYTEFKYGSCIIGLAQADEKSPFSFGGQVIYWRVENINSAISYFCTAGASIYRGPLQIEGDDVICQIQDPFGNVLGMIGKKDQT
ncbi:MAG: VOC family protein [Pseudomonadota bacterium]